VKLHPDRQDYKTVLADISEEDSKVSAIAFRVVTI
jgi:hypothetical protein